jgi:hypothetical protein
MSIRAALKGHKTPAPTTPHPWLAPGVQVTHRAFGDGVVSRLASCAGMPSVFIVFPRVGEREFLLAFVEVNLRRCE